ncbi:hypothetical protein OCU04_008449 [Sclerotinia nivalis]|uniref:Uncharacterized protein n=1 Tax=Sclerotinia nivalis TaxID=352851 RepID=A0A9X0DIU0_9HELO|nr:hypothetical protein OCU04_008449 [Sclerotinia nivalis]
MIPSFLHFHLHHLLDQKTILYATKQLPQIHHVPSSFLRLYIRLFSWTIPFLWYHVKKPTYYAHVETGGKFTLKKHFIRVRAVFSEVTTMAILNFLASIFNL